MGIFKKLFLKQMRNIITILEDKEVIIRDTQINHDNFGQEKAITITIEYETNQK